MSNILGEFDEKEIEEYEQIGKKVKISKEIENIDEKIEVLKVKEDIEQISLKEEIDSLLERKKILIEEESDISDSDEYKSIIGNLDTIKSLKVKLEKLQGKKGQISDNVFNKLQQEYQEEYKKNELILLKETERIQQLHEKLESFIKNIDTIKEEEKLRFDLGEYTENEFNDIINSISSNEKKIESVLYATSVLLEEFKNELR